MKLPHSPLIVAHRGDSKFAPENTLSAFASAIAKGVDAIELDVHLSRDGALVVHHDFYLGRTNTGSGFIGDYTLAALRALDAGSWFAPAFAGERIPTLLEVLELGKGRVRFEIECKDTSRSFLIAMLEALARCGVTDAVELTSPHIPILIEAARLAPHVRRGMFVSASPDWMGRVVWQRQVLDYLHLTQVQVAHLPISLLNKAFVEQLHAEGFLVHAANLNHESEIDLGLRVRVDQFSTENIELAQLKTK